MMNEDVPPREGVSRRGFLKGAGATVAAGSLLGAGAAPAAAEAAAGPIMVLRAKDMVPVSFNLNGRQTVVHVRTGQTLLEVLRDRLDMTGTKLVCDRGTCGACTVIMDGRPVNACLTLAVDAHASAIETIEGLSEDGHLHPVQQAFLEEDALQCGFCTPGMVMSCKALLDEKPRPTLDQTKEALSGNLCRCGTYASVFRAVDKAGHLMREGR